MHHGKLIRAIITMAAIIIALILISTNSGIQSDIGLVYHDISFQKTPSNSPLPKKENITLNMYYGGNEYSLHLQVNRSIYRQLQYYSGAEQGYMYLYYNFTSGPSSVYRVYSSYITQDSGNTWFPGITHVLEQLLVLWVAYSNYQLSFHSMSYIDSTFTASYNASSYWNELSQQIELGTGWVFNHVDFVGSAISALEKLLMSSTEYTQVENFVMFLFTLFSGSQSLQKKENADQFNLVTSTLLKYNVVNSSTYSDADILNGIIHLDNVTIHNLTISLFTDLYGAAYLSNAVSIGTSVMHIFVNDSISMGIDGATQVAVNLAAQESIDNAVIFALSDVSLSFITVDLPLALIAAFADLLNKDIQVPLNYIGVEYHIEKAVYQNLSKKYTSAMAHLTLNNEPNLSSMSNAADYYVIILAFISLWYYVNMHLNAGNSAIVHSDRVSLNFARVMINQFDSEVSDTI